MSDEQIVPPTRRKTSPLRTAIGFIVGLALALATRAGYVPFLPKMLELPAPLYYFAFGSFVAAVAGIDRLSVVGRRVSG